MDDFLRWLASWRGVELEPGAELQFELSAFPSGGLAMLILLGCALALVAIAFFYRRDGQQLATWQRVLLASLRVLAVLLAIAVLLEPNLVSVKRETRPGHTLLLVDTSQSMTHVDAYRRDEVQAIAQGWRDIGIDDPAGRPRLELLRALLGREGGALVARLGRRNVPQLYAFAGALEHLPLLPPPPVAEPAESTDPADPTDHAALPRLDLARLQADGRATNLGGALRTALDRSRASEIAAVVILGDGRRNAGPQGAEIARLLQQRKIPHTFVLGIGDPSETQTVELARHEAPAKVFQKDPFEMKSVVAAQGYDPMTVTVRLVRSDDKGVEVVAGTRQVQLGGERGEVTVEWSGLVADAPGRFLYRAEVVPPDGEPAVAERHTRTVAVEVLDEKVRVLLIAGASTFEYQMLHNLLIRDKTIAVSCWVQNADPKFRQDGDEETRIESLPANRQQLDVYDVAILVDPNPERLPRAFGEQLALHVTEGGAGLWWVCGEKFTHAALLPAATTAPLAELLPVHCDVDFAQRKMALLGVAYPNEIFYELLPEGAEGLGAKVTRLAGSKDESRILWDGLPGFYFWFPVKGLKPAATCVVASTDRNPMFRRNGRGMPMIALQNVGAGRVLYLGTDDTYRWRRNHEQAYDEFWVNGIRYLFEGRIHAGNSRLVLLADADRVDLGDAVQLTAEVKDEALQPWLGDSFVVTVERDGRESTNAHLMPIASTPGSYGLQLRPTELGAYRVRPATKIGKPVEATFQVVAARVEREGPMDRAELAAIAAVPGGELCTTPAGLLAALERIPSRSATDTFRTPHPLWDGWATVVLILCLLSIEWILRKRFNLL
jgi:hypothetical protein